MLEVMRALARLKPKRSAACRQVALAEIADAMHWRKSSDKVVGIASSSAPSLPANQHSF